MDDYYYRILAGEVYGDRTCGDGATVSVLVNLRLSFDGFITATNLVQGGRSSSTD